MEAISDLFDSGVLGFGFLSVFLSVFWVVAVFCVAVRRSEMGF